jgi:two-component system sensor histidine kinase PilS (NtrC family)
MTRRSLNLLTAIRLAVLLVILISAVLLHTGSGVDLPVAFLDFLIGLNAAALVLGVFQWTMSRSLPYTLLAYIQLVGDILLVSVLVYSSGGPYSVFNFLYLVVIGASAFLLARPGAVIVASAAALLYGGIVELLAKGILPAPPLTPVSDWTANQVRYNFGISVVGFYGVAFMAGYLSEKLRATRSELARRQKALQRLQNLHGNVIATMSSGLMTTDSKQRITFVNRAAGAILGVDPARAAGMTLAEFDFVLPENWTTVWNRENQWDSFREEIEIDRDGSRRVLGYSLRGLMDADGELGLLILFQDLTEIKKLERRVRFNEQLAAVGELAAGIAHEIRNPLGPGPLQRALCGVRRAPSHGDHRLGIQPPFQDPGGLPPFRAAWGAPSGGLRRRQLRDRGHGSLPALRRGLRCAPDRSPGEAVPLGPGGRPGSGPADHLQRRQERGPGDGGRRHAHGRRARGERLV